MAKKLEQHLFCWLLDTDPRTLNASIAHRAQELRELHRRLHAARLDELPRQPLSLPMLMRALSDDQVGRSELTRIILKDAALTDQLLQVANSPYFRHGDHTVESIDQAVFLLGVDGIRNVVAAALMRPVLAARNSREALFAQRTWRWGLTCARSAEMIARQQDGDPNGSFMAGLIPALAYMTLYRELHRICRPRDGGGDPEPALIRHVLARHQWATCQILANEWQLPPKYHAMLLSAERPVPRNKHTPLSDGLILGTREVLRHAHQRNLPEEELLQLINLPPEGIAPIRQALREMLQTKEG